MKKNNLKESLKHFANSGIWYPQKFAEVENKRDICLEIHFRGIVIFWRNAVTYSSIKKN